MWLWYRPKSSKMSIGIFFNEVCNTERKNCTNEIPVKLWIGRKFFMAKITILKFSPFFTGISNNHDLTFNPRLAGGRQNLPPAPSWFSRITPKPLQISTQNLAYLILHQFDIEWPNFVEISENFFEKLIFVGSLHTNFEQN